MVVDASFAHEGVEFLIALDFLNVEEDGALQLDLLPSLLTHLA